MKKSSDTYDDIGAARDNAAHVEVTRDAFLGGKVTLYQPKDGYRAGVDPVLLAASIGATHKGAQRVIDVGAGPGTVGLLIAQRVNGAKVTCVEIEEALVRIGRRNIEENNLQPCVDFIHADIFKPVDVLASSGLCPGQFDEVVSNPPFYSEAAARVSGNHLKRRANSMGPDGLDRWIKFMTIMARANGRLSMIYPAERLDDLLRLLSGRFGNFQIFPVYPRAGEAAIRVIIRGRKGSRAPLRLHSGLVLHERDGSYTREASAILRAGSALDLPFP